MNFKRRFYSYFELILQELIIGVSVQFGCILWNTINVQFGTRMGEYEPNAPEMGRFTKPGVTVKIHVQMGYFTAFFNYLRWGCLLGISIVYVGGGALYRLVDGHELQSLGSDWI